MEMQVLMNLKYWKLFPDCPKEFPMKLLNESHALSMHSQSLDKLNSRGGMSPAEIVGNVNKMEYYYIENMKMEDAVRRIKQYIKNYEDNC